MSSITAPAWYNDTLAPPIGYVASTILSVIVGTAVAPNRIMLAAGIMLGFWVVLMIAGHLIEGFPNSWLHSICVIIGAVVAFVYTLAQAKSQRY